MLQENPHRLVGKWPVGIHMALLIPPALYIWVCRTQCVWCVRLAYAQMHQPVLGVCQSCTAARWVWWMLVTMLLPLVHPRTYAWGVC